MSHHFSLFYVFLIFFTATRVIGMKETIDPSDISCEQNQCDNIVPLVVTACTAYFNHEHVFSQSQKNIFHELCIRSNIINTTYQNLCKLRDLTQLPLSVYDAYYAPVIIAYSYRNPELFKQHASKSSTTLLNIMYHNMITRKTIDLRSSKLSNIPNMKVLHVQQAYFSYNALMTLPHHILSSNSLQELHCDANLLSKIPTNIENFTYLKRLNLSNNRIAMLPRNMQQLTLLEEINLSDNQLSDISVLFRLYNITKLLAMKNHIRQIHGIERLVNLHKLVLCDNELTSIEGIEQLDRLGYLYLADNRISDLPSNLSRLRLLQIFTLNNNRLTNPKTSLQSLPKFKSNTIIIDLRDNPCPTIPETIQGSFRTSTLWKNISLPTTRD